MIEPDTIKLLRECDAGIQMGVKTIDDVLEHVKSRDLGKLLQDGRQEHARLGERLETLLHQYGDKGKEPGFLIEKMAAVKTGVKLGLDGGDNTAAALITDGCNMGIKSLSRYLNQYAAADEQSKGLAKELIGLESRMEKDLRDFL